MERAHSTGFEVKHRSPLRGLFKCPADFSSVILSFEGARHCDVVLQLSQGSEKEKQKVSFFFFFFFKFTVTDRRVFFLSFVARTGQQVVIADKVQRSVKVLMEGPRQHCRSEGSLSEKLNLVNGTAKVRTAARNQSKAFPACEE